MTDLTTSMREVMAQTTMSEVITGGKRFAMRLRLGVAMIRAAARVIGMPVDITIDAETPPRPVTVEDVARMVDAATAAHRAATARGVTF